jgi:hypothetical protein
MTTQPDDLAPNVIDDHDSLARANSDAADDALSAVVSTFYHERFARGITQAAAWAEVNRDDVTAMLEFLAHLAEAIGENPGLLFAQALAEYTVAVAAEAEEIKDAPPKDATCPKCRAQIPNATRWFGPCTCQRRSFLAPDAVGKVDEADRNATALMTVYAALTLPGKPYDVHTDDGAAAVADVHADLAHHLTRHDHAPENVAIAGLLSFAIEHEEAEVQRLAEAIETAEREAAHRTE